MTCPDNLSQRPLANKGGKILVAVCLADNSVKTVARIDKRSLRVSMGVDVPMVTAAENPSDHGERAIERPEMGQIPGRCTNPDIPYHVGKGRARRIFRAVKRRREREFTTHVIVDRVLDHLAMVFDVLAPAEHSLPVKKLNYQLVQRYHAEAREIRELRLKKRAPRKGHLVNGGHGVEGGTHWVWDRVKPELTPTQRRRAARHRLNLSKILAETKRKKFEKLAEEAARKNATDDESRRRTQAFVDAYSTPEAIAKKEEKYRLARERAAGGPSTWAGPPPVDGKKTKKTQKEKEKALKPGTALRADGSIAGPPKPIKKQKGKPGTGKKKK